VDSDKDNTDIISNTDFTDYTDMAYGGGWREEKWRISWKFQNKNVTLQREM
jgi:hypothetical protein